MDSTQSKRLVLVSTITIAGTVLAKHEGLNTFKSLWAAGALAIVLSLVADVAPQVAGPLAVLVALSMLTSGGQQALGGIVQKATGATAPTPKREAPK